MSIFSEQFTETMQLEI